MCVLLTDFLGFYLVRSPLVFCCPVPISVPTHPRKRTPGLLPLVNSTPAFSSALPLRKRLPICVKAQTDMPIYFGWFLLQQMTLAAMYSWWLMPLVSKGVRFEISPPLLLCEASLPPRW